MRKFSENKTTVRKQEYSGKINDYSEKPLHSGIFRAKNNGSFISHFPEKCLSEVFRKITFWEFFGKKQLRFKLQEFLRIMLEPGVHQVNSSTLCQLNSFFNIFGIHRIAHLQLR